MKSLSLNGWPLCIGVILLGVGCRKQDAFLSPNSQAVPAAKTASAVHPLDEVPGVIHVGVFYDNSGQGTVFVSWDGDNGTYKVSVGGVGSTFLAYGNTASVQHHFNSGSTITASVSTLDGTASGTGSYYYDASGNPSGSLIYNPIPPFSNMEITSDLGGCTMNFTWTPPTPFTSPAYFYLQLRSPDVPGSDGYWSNYVLGQCSSNDGHFSIHINRYYYNDPVINARLVIQNIPYSTLPPPYPNLNDGRFNLFFHLPDQPYHYSGTLNQFYQNF